MKYMFTLSIFLILSLLPGYAVSLSSEKYSPRNCEFTAVFPGKPIIKDIHVSGYFHQSATLKRSNYVLRASCSIFKSRSVFDVHDNVIIEWAQGWAQRMGMIYPEVSIENTRIGRVVTVKGAKKIQGESYIFKAVSYHGKFSRMTIVVGSPASVYPTTEMIPFLNSVTN